MGQDAQTFQANKFVNFLQAYGPFDTCNALYDEHVRKKAKSCCDENNVITPFSFEMRMQSQYKKIVQSCVEERTSKVFLIAGQAGDGKTHFLHELCANIFGVPDTLWDTIIDQDHQHYELKDSQSFISSEKAASDEIKYGMQWIDLTVQDTAVRLYVITDLSTLERPEDKDELFKVLTHIAKTSAASAPCSAAAAGGSGIASGASANGSDMASNASVGGLSAELADKPIYLLIAGNNGRILSTFDEFAQHCKSFDVVKTNGHGADLDAGSGLGLGNGLGPGIDSEMGAGLFGSIGAGLGGAAASLLQDIERHMILNQKFKSKFIELLSLTDCLDRQGVENIFRVVLNDPNWDKCSRCVYLDKCPINANRLALSNDAVIKHFADIFELANDDGLHLTVRNLMVVLSNAILGNQDRKVQKRCFTCLKVSNSIKNDFMQEYYGESVDRRSSPFDNLLGANLNKKNFDDDFGAETSIFQSISNSPIYHQLDTFGIGKESTKLIDNFITSGCLAYAEEMSRDGVVKSKLAAKYQELVVAHDTIGLHDKLKKTIEYIQEEPESSTDTKASINNGKRLQELICSIRRLMFFTASADDRSTQSFPTYALTNLRYAAEYLELKRKLNQSCVINSEDSTLLQLLCGLNRAFTTLPVVKSNDRVYVSFNNRINPAAFCIIPDKENFEVSFKSNERDFQNVLRVVSSAVLNDFKQRPTLVYYSYADAAKQAHTYDSSDENDISIIKADDKEKVLCIIDTDRSFKGHLRGQNRNYKDLCSESEKFSEFYDFLKSIKDDEDLWNESYEDALKILSNCFDSDDLMTESRVTYPPQALSNGLHPNAAAQLTLNPRLFDYLMSLGSGVNGISVSNECYEELIAFKSRVDSVITSNIDTILNKSIVSSDATSENIQSLRFCTIDSKTGEIKAQ